MANSNPIPASIWVDQRMAALDAGKEWQPDIGRGLARLRELQGRRRHVRWSWVAVAAAACVIAAMLPQPRVFAHYCFDCTVSIWQSLASAPASSTVKLEASRQAAPDFTLNDAAGRSVQLASLKGKVVLLDFWATWCHGCKVEMPWFMDFEKQYKDRGFEVIGISTDDDGWKSITPYVEQKKVNYTVVMANDEVKKAYGLDAIPLTFLIDRDGRVAATCAGLATKSDYRTAIETLLQEKDPTSPN
jgi:peroxiredoxin